LWRHRRPSRPCSEPTLLVAGLPGDLPPLFGQPLWWDSVYAEDMLLRTWCLLRGRDHLVLPDEIDVLVRAISLEQEDIPEALMPRFNAAIEKAEKERAAYRTLASHAIIGSPNDGSWNQPERFVLYDEDAPEVHRTLLAKTRLGKDSVVVIPVLKMDEFGAAASVCATEAKHLYQSALSLSRKSVVRMLQSAGVPAGWKSSPLLRNAYAMLLDADRRWLLDRSVRLDDELGFVYEAK
jgi:CRISPR-associated endonuclease/helicase Cas3